MAQVLELGARGAGLVSPNPLVGALLVKDGRIVGEGSHRFKLMRHAESYALEQAGATARGATLYCNLEPCSHQGRTPPCARSLIEAGVSRVVIGMIDPDPRVNGLGVQRLKQAGINVTVGVMERECVRLNEIYLKYVRTHRPFLHEVQLLELDHSPASERRRWVPSDELVRLALAYDVLFLGQGLEINRAFLRPFLARKSHRAPIVALNPKAMRAVAAVNGNLPNAPTIGQADSVEASAPTDVGVQAITSIFALRSGALLPSAADKLTLVCKRTDASSARAELREIVSELEAGALVEIMGYPKS